MTVFGALLLLLGLAASWVAGRFVEKGASLIQIGAVTLCGLAAFFYGMTGLVAISVYWALGALLVYGIIGAILFRSGQMQREGAR